MPYLLAIPFVIALGLASRERAWVPHLVYLYAGDTLWALNLYLVLRVLRPKARLHHTAGVAYGLSVLVEVGQLLQGPNIDAVRRTLFGRLVLGSGFLWSDLVCYAVGVFIGWRLDRLIRVFRIFR